MIIACPACGARYQVRDGAIGPEGRTVRCAKCRESWFQGLDGPTVEDVDTGAVIAEPGVPASPPVEPPPEPAPIPVEQPALVEEPPVPKPKRPRPWLRALKYAILAFIVLLAALAASLWFFGPPTWLPVPQAVIGRPSTDLVLDFPAQRQERRTLDNGTQYYGVSGTITNTGRETHLVPVVRIVLRDTTSRIVYSWEVTPPKRTLAPGEAVSISEAVTDVPGSAHTAEVRWET